MKTNLWVGFAFAAALSAQAPNPTQVGVEQTGGTVPIFRVEVTSRTIRAVSYHHRKGTTEIDFRGTALMPDARGHAEVTPNDGATRISLKFDHLTNPSHLGSEFLTLVLWGVTPEGRAERLGEVTLRNMDDTKAELYATTDLQSFGMIVTAEPYFSVSQPSDVVVMENFQTNETTGTMETVEAKYELLKRGQYFLNINSNRLSALTSDLKVPLQLREAREAISIAKAQGADRYAADTMAKANIGLLNAEGYFKSKRDLKMLETSAREATQMAEDARRITIEKQQAEAKQAMVNSEAAARQRADEEARLRAQAESQKRAAETATAEAQRQRREAESATASAKMAQAEAEAARQAAANDKQAALNARADAEKARGEAEMARAKAEADAHGVRARLLEQFNMILSTRDTARGLIVNMSDVLFGFNQADLKPGTKEKLAKVSGIMLAYPTLKIAIEGHTDSIGSEDYNQKLSEKRAEAVRSYMVENGIPAASVTASGFGKTRPVATNDTDAGRQQNRRVELVVSGDIIGQPLDNGAASNVNPAANPAVR